MCVLISHGCSALACFVNNSAPLRVDLSLEGLELGVLSWELGGEKERVTRGGALGVGGN